MRGLRLPTKAAAGLPTSIDDEHGRGLAIVAAIAGDGNWGIDGNAASRTTWFRLNWHQTLENAHSFVRG